MTAITGQDYYKAHIREEKEFLRVYAAYPVRKGEALKNSNSGPAPEDGYEIGYHFYTNEEFAAATTPADNLALPAPKNNLCEYQRADLARVKKGDEITAADKQTGQMLEQTADHDGFVVPFKSKKIYLTNFEFSAYFNDTVKKCQTEQDAIPVILNEENQAQKGILITCSVILSYGDCTRMAVAGDVLYLHRNDSSFTIDSGYNLNHRMTERSTNAAANTPAALHKVALTQQAELKSVWLKKKALKAGTESTSP